MLRYVIVIIMIIIGGNASASAHQFLPTYPKFQYSFIDGVMTTKMELFNKRKDVEYYELGVFDSDWGPVSFASESRLINIKYLETKQVNVYVRKEDIKRVTYICTESKIKKQDVQNTVISSKICSKVR